MCSQASKISSFLGHEALVLALLPWSMSQIMLEFLFVCTFTQTKIGPILLIWNETIKSGLLVTE
uniref:Uncharacterized protein n=1 Tax=Rhizophora mucronata TaxID=61149 RepID=A0A2P2MX50_RHIMU